MRHPIALLTLTAGLGLLSLGNITTTWAKSSPSSERLAGGPPPSQPTSSPTPTSSQPTSSPTPTSTQPMSTPTTGKPTSTQPMSTPSTPKPTSTQPMSTPSTPKPASSASPTSQTNSTTTAPMTTPNTVVWYNCRTREVWSPEKTAWCQKVEKLKNTSYQLPGLGEGNSAIKIQLQNGGYVNNEEKQRIIFVDQSGLITFGNIKNDNNEDAVSLLVVNADPSNSFIYLTPVINVNQNPQNVGSVFLGDRVQVQSIKLNNRQIEVKLIKHTPNDAKGTPTLPVTQIYRLEGNKLIWVSETKQ